MLLGPLLWWKSLCNGHVHWKAQPWAWSILSHCNANRKFTFAVLNMLKSVSDRSFLIPTNQSVWRHQPNTTYNTHSLRTILLQDGGLLPSCCSMLPPLRNQIYQSPRRHILTTYVTHFPILLKNFSKLFQKIFWALFLGPRGSCPYFWIPLLPLHIPIFFPTFRPLFSLPSSRYSLPSTSRSSKYFP